MILTIGGQKARLINFSKKGFGVVSSKYWGRNIVLDVEVRGETPAIGETLERYQINRFSVVVKWGAILGEGNFRHRLEISSRNEVQLKALHEVFRSETSQLPDEAASA